MESSLLGAIVWNDDLLGVGAFAGDVLVHYQVLRSLWPANMAFLQLCRCVLTGLNWVVLGLLDALCTRRVLQELRIDDVFVSACCVCGLGRCLRLNILTADLSTTDDIGQVEYSVLDISDVLVLLLMLH